MSAHPLLHPLPKPLLGFEHVSRYWDVKLDVPAAKILPGECYVSNKGEMISTVLGSCIAVCVRDKKLGIGGMNHFMLPIQSGDTGISRSHSVNPALCYGNWAMEFLLNAIYKLGGRRENLEIKVFGGGRVLTGMTNIDVGKRNIKFIMEFLASEGLAITSKDVGDICPRKVLYFTQTGSVKLKRLTSVANTVVSEREKQYLESMRKQPVATDVELF